MSYKKMKKAFLKGKGKLLGENKVMTMLDEVGPFEPQVVELVEEGKVKIIDPITIKSEKKPKATSKKTAPKTKAKATTKKTKTSKKTTKKATSKKSEK